MDNRPRQKSKRSMILLLILPILVFNFFFEIENDRIKNKFSHPIPHEYSDMVGTWISVGESQDQNSNQKTQIIIERNRKVDYQLILDEIPIRRNGIIQNIDDASMRIVEEGEFIPTLTFFWAETVDVLAIDQLPFEVDGSHYMEINNTLFKKQN